MKKEDKVEELKEVELETESEDKMEDVLQMEQADMKEAQ